MIYTCVSCGAPKMDSKECSEFINQIVRFASEQGIVISSPEEYFQK